MLYIFSYFLTLLTQNKLVTVAVKHFKAQMRCILIKYFVYGL